MSRPYRVPTDWTDDAARLVWEDYSSRVRLDRGPLIGVEYAVDLEEAADIFHDHDDPEAAARDAIKCLAAHGLAALNEEYACWRGRNCQETTANRLRAWAAVGAPVVSPDAARATAEGLHRIGVAVAVWAGMAVAHRDPPTPSERVASGMVRVLRTLLADAEDALRAERAARRKWELRLRWRAENSYEQRHPDLDDIDRLYRHEVCAQRDPQKNTERLGNGITRFRWYFDAARRLPIAGPRGVLP